MYESRRFEENQRFPTAFVVIAVFYAGLFPLIMYGWKGDAISTADLTLIALAGAIPFLLLFGMKLTTTVEGNLLQVRLFPLPARKIPLAEIREAAVRTYGPLREFGGWGIRYGFKAGWAYNARGNRGVQLVLDGGKKVLIGSQQPDQLLSALRREQNS